VGFYFYNNQSVKVNFHASGNAVRNSKQAFGDDASKVRCQSANFSYYFLIFSVCSVGSMDLSYLPEHWQSHADSASMVDVVASVGTQTECA